MSMLLMVKAMKTKVGNPTRKLVLIKLADNANDEGYCWPSYRNIADHCEIDRRTAMRHVDSLEKAGFLKKTWRKSNSENKNKSNIYYLILEGGDNLTLGVVSEDHQGGDRVTLGGGDPLSPRTSHSFEPVIEPILVSDKSQTDDDLKKSKFKFSEKDMLFAEMMYKKIKEVNASFNKSNLNAWAHSIRIMRERDGIKMNDYRDAFLWANNNSFWQSNIQSPEKLRKQYSQLTGKMQYEQTNTSENKSFTGKARNQSPAIAPYERILQNARNAGHDV